MRDFTLLHITFDENSIRICVSQCAFVFFIEYFIQKRSSENRWSVSNRIAYLLSLFESTEEQNIYLRIGSLYTEPISSFEPQRRRRR